MALGTEGVAGIVLAGGRSRRMGTAKAALEWHGSTLLRRTTGVLSRAVTGPVLVVRAPGAELPPLPPAVQVHDDPVSDRGPLQGMAVGLAAARRAGCQRAFVCATDLPFLHPHFIRRVLRALDGHADAAVPRAHGFRQPLAAGYRTALATHCAQLVAQDRLAMAILLDSCATVVLDEEQLLDDEALAGVDPQLESLVNLNEPADYRASRDRPGPQVTVQGRDVPGSDAGRGLQIVRAATLAGAAAAVCQPLDRRVLVLLNGEPTSGDPHLPLVGGDAVDFVPRDAVAGWTGSRPPTV